MMAHAYDLSIQEMEAKESEVQGHLSYIESMGQSEIQETLVLNK